MEKVKRVIETKRNKTRDLPAILRIIVGVLVFGSIWGFLEATVGGLFHLFNVPNAGAIMAGAGTAVMGAALAIYRKPAILPAIAIIAASFKLLNVWLLFVPANVPHIVNPVAAIILEALAFSIAVVFLMERIEKNTLNIIWPAVLAGLLSATAFACFAVYVTHASINARAGLDSIREFVMGNGLVQAMYSGVLAPLGYMLGKKLAAITSPVFTSRPLNYAISASTVLLCWGFSAVAVMAGL